MKMWGNQGGFDGDGGSLQGGGGYVTSPGGFGSPTPTQSRGKRAQNLIPCTIAQILKSQAVDDGFRCGEVDLHQVAIVGVIMSMDIQATHIRYELEDMTGPSMEIRQWIDNDENADQQPEVFQPGTYVKIIGSVRAFGGKTTVSPFKIAPLTDLNEITVHILEVIHAHMFLTKKKKQMGAPATPGLGNMSMQTPNKMQGAQGGDYGNVANHGLSSVQRDVHQLIVSCPDEQGISLNQLKAALTSKKVSMEHIRAAVEFLSNEGHIYSTIDDDHFKSTEG